MEIKVRIPENLKIAELLKAANIEPTPKIVDKIAFICYSLHCSEANRRNETKRFTGSDINNRPYYPLYSVILDSYIHDYNKVLEILIQQIKVFETDNKYIVGEKSRGYRFSEAYYGVKFIDHTIVDFTLHKKLQKYLSKKNNIEIHADSAGEAAKYSFLKRYWQKNKLKIDKPAAIHWIEEISKSMFYRLGNDQRSGKLKDSSTDTIELLKKKIVENRELIITLIDRFDMGLYYFNVDNFSQRLHTNLTSIKKEARNYISYNGEKLVSLDIKNSSLYFLLALFKKDFWVERKRIPKNLLSLQRLGLLNQLDSKTREAIIDTIMLLKNPETPLSKVFWQPDIFVNLVVSGKIYDDALEDYKWEVKHRNGRTKIKTREQIKKKFLTYLYHDPNSETQYDSELNPVTMIERWYPQITALINLVKKADYTLLAKILQKIESYLVIEVICKKISKNKDIPLFTIHDGIVTTEKNAPAVLKIMEDELERFIGFKPTIKQEAWQHTPYYYYYNDIATTDDPDLEVESIFQLAI